MPNMNIRILFRTFFQWAISDIVMPNFSEPILENILIFQALFLPIVLFRHNNFFGITVR